MNSEIIKRIIAPKQDKISNSKRAVIYTRVSTKEQADTNASLETQLKYCREYCQKYEYQIAEEFGGTYESAQSDDARKEFNRMLDFARLKKNDIRIIVVFSYDRFSRSGGNGISLITELMLKYNIQVRSVTQATDVSTPEGQLQTNILMLFSKYDNDMRSQKVRSGMREKLLQGFHVFGAPYGYSSSATAGIPEPNDKAKFVQMAFEMKVQFFSHDLIIKRLKNEGCKLDIKRLTAIYKNPFYCGYITSSLINHDVVKGKHKAIISEELFLKVIDAKIKYNKAHYIKKEEEAYPLKGFLICSKCRGKWTAYHVKKKNIDYYKCNTIGCKCNRNANQLHQEFKNFLNEYKIPDVLERPLRAQLKMVFNEQNKERVKEQEDLGLQLKRLEEQIETVMTRYGIAEIPKQVYETTIQKLNTTKHGIMNRIEEAKIQLSNQGEFIDFSINLSRNIDQAWISGDAALKNRLQNVLFPKGIEYDNKNRAYRTTKVNSLFILYSSLSGKYKSKVEGENISPSINTGLVVPAGIEPASKV